MALRIFGTATVCLFASIVAQIPLVEVGSRRLRRVGNAVVVSAAVAWLGSVLGLIWTL